MLPEAGRGEPARATKEQERKRRREIRPPERRCQDCSDFLKDKKTLEIPCKQCGTPIYWPPESQLQTHLGAWAEPAMCGACKRDAIEAARNAEREALRPQRRSPAARGRDAAGAPVDAPRPRPAEARRAAEPNAVAEAPEPNVYPALAGAARACAPAGSRRAADPAPGSSRRLDPRDLRDLDGARRRRAMMRLA